MAPGFVYFIQVKSGPIKIGHAKRPIARCTEFQVGHYEEIKLLGVLPGSRSVEKRLHIEMQKSRIRGEWFKPSDEVMALVAQTQQPPPEVTYVRSAHVIPPKDRQIIEAALKETGGRIGKAATLLGCSRRTLQNIMRDIGMPRGQPGRKPYAIPRL